MKICKVISFLVFLFQVIKPAYHVKNLDLWDSLYQNALLPCTIVNTSAVSSIVSENCVTLQEEHRRSPIVPLAKNLPPPQPLEVATPSTVTTSSGPPTHVGFSHEDTNMNQKFVEDLFVGDLPRSQSLSTLSMTNFTVEDQLLPKTTVEAPFTIPTPTSVVDSSLPPQQTTSIRSSSLSAPRTHIEIEADNQIQVDRKQLSHSHADFFGKVFQFQQTIPAKLETDYATVNLVKSMTTPKARGEIGEVICANLRPFHSDREISKNRQSDHVRHSSDPPSARTRLRVAVGFWTLIYDISFMIYILMFFVLFT